MSAQVKYGYEGQPQQQQQYPQQYQQQGPYTIPPGGAPPQYPGYPAAPAAAPNVVIVQGAGATSCPSCHAAGTYIPTQTTGWKFQLAGCYMWLGLIGCSIGFALDKPRKCTSCGFEDDNGTKSRGMCLFFSGLIWHIAVFAAIIAVIVIEVNNANNVINNYPY